MRPFLRFSLALLAFTVFATAQNTIPTNPDTTDYSAFVSQQLDDMLLAGSGEMVTLGLNIVNGFGFSVFSLILIRWAYQSYHGHHFQINLQPIAAFLFLIAVIDTMLYFYAVPIPGVGVSFSQLPAKIATEITSFLDQGVYVALMSRLHEFTVKLQEPLGIFNIKELAMYYAVLVCVTFAESLLFAVTIYGYIYYALAALVGPIFVSFLIFPAFRSYFHSWLGTLLRFAFYQIAAKALVFIWANVWIRVFDAGIAGDYSLNNAFAMFIPFCMINLALLGVCFRLPHFVDNLFSGSASAGHGGMIPAVVSRMF